MREILKSPIVLEPVGRTARTSCACLTSVRRLLLPILLLLLTVNSAVSQTIITFEEVPSGTVLTNQYGAKGVHFDGSTTGVSSFPNSGHNVLYSVSPGVEAFSFPGPLVVRFDTGQSLVRIHAGTNWTDPVTATLTAFDAAGHVVAHDGPRTLAPAQVKTVMEVKTPQQVIQNDGDGPARGPFAVTLGVSFSDDNGVQSTRQLNIQIPTGTTIEGHGTQYVTEALQNIPLVYRNEHPHATYRLEMIVDSNNQISEVSESNNYLGMNYWAVAPAIA